MGWVCGWKFSSDGFSVAPGTEEYQVLLRGKVREELENNSEWYLERVSQGNFDTAIREATGQFEYLTLLHAAALSNYLRRPVFVLDEVQSSLYLISAPGHQGATVSC